LGACSPVAPAPPAPPAAPSGLSAVAISSTVIELTWSNNDLRTQSINVDRKYDVRNSWLALTVFGLKSFFQNTNLKPSTVYCYRMKTIVDGLVSAYSNETCARTKPAE
jgi:titin